MQVVPFCGNVRPATFEQPSNPYDSCQGGKGIRDLSASNKHRHVQEESVLSNLDFRNDLEVYIEPEL